MKKKHPKMDRYKISLKQPWEITWVITRMAQYAVKVTADQVRAAVKAVGNGRQKVYKYLTENN
jgi:Protein of unknown function (DUF3606)